MNKSLTTITSTDPTESCASETHCRQRQSCHPNRLAPRRSSGKSRRGSADEEQRKFDVVMECHGNEDSFSHGEESANSGANPEATGAGEDSP